MSSTSPSPSSLVHPDRASRTATQRRGLSRRPGSPTHPRPPPPRETLPPLRRASTSWSLMDAINQARPGLGSQPPSSSTKRSSMRTAPSCPPTPSASTRISPTTAVGLLHPLLVSPQHGRTAVPARSYRQPPVSSRLTSTSTSRSTSADGPAFRKILMRGDTKFTQTSIWTRLDEAGDVRFIFGFEARDSLKGAGRRTSGRGLQLPGTTRSSRSRPVPPRASSMWPGRRSSSNAATRRSTCSMRMVGEFDHRSDACQRTYRMAGPQEAGDRQGMMAVRGVSLLLYITNDRDIAEQVVFSVNDRCDQGEPDRAACRMECTR